MTEAEKLELLHKFNCAFTLQFMDMLEKDGKNADNQPKPRARKNCG